MVWASLLLAVVSLLQPQTGARRPAPGPPKPAAPPAYLRAIESRVDQGNMARIVLRSGLVLLVEEQAADPLVAVQTTIQAGTADEGPDKGVAALLARLLLRGSGFADGVQKLSGTARIQIGPYSTVFSSVAPVDNLPRILTLHSELLTFPKLADPMVARERQLLQEERRREGSALELVRRRLSGKAEPDAGDQLDMARLRAFHQRHYRKPNAILGIVGGVIREQLLEKVVELYGRGRAAPEERKVAGEAALAGFSYTFSQGKVSQPYVFLRYRGPGRTDPDFYPFLLVAYALGQGADSAFGTALQSDGNLVLAEASNPAFTEDPSLVVTLVPAEGRIDAMEVETLARADVIRLHGLNEDQLEAAKALFLTDFYSRLATMEERACALAVDELLGKGLDRDAIPRRIAAVGMEDIKRAAARYLGPANLAIVELLPESAEARTFTPQSYQEMLRTLLPPAVAKLTETKELAIRAEGPSLGPTLSFKPKYLKYELKKTSVVRGPDIYYQEDRSAPLVHVGLFYPGGRFKESAGKRGITQVMLEAVVRTALRAKGRAAAGDLDQIGAKISIVDEPDFFGFQAVVLSNHLDELLRTLIEWVRHVQIEETDVNAARESVLARLRLQQDRNEVIPGAPIWEGHPYGASRYGTADDLQLIDLAAVQEWRKTQIGETHPLILVRGDVQGTSFLEQFVSALSDRRLKPAEVQPPEEEPKPAVAAAEAGPGALAFAGPARRSRDERILQVAEGLLDGPGGPLVEELWEKQGIAFPVDFSHRAYLQGGVICVHFEALGAREAEARQEVLKSFQALQKEPPRRDLFMAAVSRSIARFYLRRQDVDSFLRGLALHIFAGGDAGLESEFLGAVKELQPEDVQLFAQTFFAEPGGTQ
ncbi:MAG: M16 family metallopeptidase [Acidobacteriota bacterium]